METTSLTGVVPLPRASEYELSNAESLLVRWAHSRKAFRKEAKAAIESFYRRKPGANLDCLTENEINALKIEATKYEHELMRRLVD